MRKIKTILFLFFRVRLVRSGFPLFILKLLISHVRNTKNTITNATRGTTPDDGASSLDRLRI